MEQDRIRLQSEFHLIPTASGQLLFHIPTFTLLEVDHQFADVIRKYSAGAPLSETIAGTTLDAGSALQSVQALLEAVDQCPTAEVHAGGIHLKLLTTHKCNLRCPYCYASGGDYGKPVADLSPADATRILDVMRRTVGEIGSITLFGGEPTLNLDAVEAICNYFAERHANGEIEALPRYTLSTNGTNVTTRLLDLVNRHQIALTVSIDGPEQVTNRTRVDRAGQGVHARIAGGISRLLAEAGVPVTYEATYTSLHEQAGVSFFDVMDYLERDLHLPMGMVSRCAGPASDPLTPKQLDPGANLLALTDREFDRLLQAEPLPGSSEVVMGAIDALVGQWARDYVCPIGVSHFAITPDGDVYPCQLYIGAGTAFCMGNVGDPEFGPGSPRWDAVLQRFTGIKTSENPKCLRCWLRPLCNGCPGANYLETGITSEMSEQFCETRRAYMERILVRLYETQQDPVLWERLVANVQGLSHSATPEC
jgi:uncharacterized protein